MDLKNEEWREVKQICKNKVRRTKTQGQVFRQVDYLCWDLRSRSQPPEDRWCRPLPESSPLLESAANCLLPCGELFLVAVKVHLSLRQFSLPRREPLGSKPLLLFNLSLREEEGLPLLGDLLPLPR